MRFVIVIAPSNEKVFSTEQRNEGDNAFTVNDTPERLMFQEL